MKRFFRHFPTRMRELFPLSTRDTVLSVYIIIYTIAVCAIIQYFSGDQHNTPMVFILTIFLISRFTNGYYYGIITSFLSLFIVNFLFTYPYFHFNFTLSGYPVLFICMLSVSIITSTLTSQLMEHEKIKHEIEKEKLRANLLRSVSHDLRTPLTTIVGAVSAVLENEDTISQEKQRELLTGVAEEAKWLVSMVENLLSITKMNSEQTQINKRDEIAEEVLGEAAVKFRQRFTDMKVSIHIPDKVLIVPMDAILVEQVLINMMENAVFHGKHTTLIELRLEQDGSDARFSVCDNGVGLPQAQIPHLYTATVTVDPTDRTDANKNMGLGLSVCASIVNAHGGDISAHNRPEGGACFTFTIPMKEGNENDVY